MSENKNKHKNHEINKQIKKKGQKQKKKIYKTKKEKHQQNLSHTSSSCANRIHTENTQLIINQPLYPFFTKHQLV